MYCNNNMFLYNNICIIYVYNNVNYTLKYKDNKTILYKKLELINHNNIIHDQYTVNI